MTPTACATAVMPCAVGATAQDATILCQTTESIIIIPSKVFALYKYRTVCKEDERCKEPLLNSAILVVGEDVDGKSTRSITGVRVQLRHARLPSRSLLSGKGYCNTCTCNCTVQVMRTHSGPKGGSQHHHETHHHPRGAGCGRRLPRARRHEPGALRLRGGRPRHRTRRIATLHLPAFCGTKFHAASLALIEK